MGGRKQGQKKRRDDAPEQLAIRQARRAGMYVLMEGAQTDPKWLVYDLVTGLCVVTYWPKTTSWLGGNNRSGKEKSFEKVLTIAREEGRILAHRLKKEAAK